MPPACDIRATSSNPENCVTMRAPTGGGCVPARPPLVDLLTMGRVHWIMAGNADIWKKAAGAAIGVVGALAAVGLGFSLSRAWNAETPPFFFYNDSATT